MSNKELARRSDVQVFFAGVDITSSIKPYLISLTYTDNEEDETDDLQLKLQDKDRLWLEKWLNTAIQSAAGATVATKKEESTTEKYKVISSAAVRSRAGTQYYQYGTLAYGTIIEVSSMSGGWANFIYSGKNAYVIASALQKISSSSVSAAGGGTESKGLKIQAVITKENWNTDGKDSILECGQFELDSVEASGPPATVTIKGTSLPYSSTVRQMAKSKSWENYTMSGIANEIASKNGMTCMFLSAINPSYKRIEQYRQSDIAFLQKLCQDAGCSLKVSNNIIVVFDQASYEKKSSIRTIKYGDGTYIKYKLSTGENDTYTSCRVSWVTTSGNCISATAYSDKYDKDGDNNQCLEVKQKVSSFAEAQALAEKMLRLHNKFELTAVFTVPGDTSLVAGLAVTLEGFGAWNGKCIIKQAKHTVSGSGYITQITLRYCLSGNYTSVADGTDEQDSTDFKVGDVVMCNSGVRQFYDGVYMAAWVPSTRLYVRAVEQGGSILLVSTEPTANVYTGRVNASDMHKV